MDHDALSFDWRNDHGAPALIDLNGKAAENVRTPAEGEPAHVRDRDGEEDFRLDLSQQFDDVAATHRGVYPDGHGSRARVNASPITRASKIGGAMRTVRVRSGDPHVSKAGSDGLGRLGEPHSGINAVRRACPVDDRGRRLR